MSCLEEDALLDYLAGRLDGRATSRAREHIAMCETCHAIASDLVLSAAANVEQQRAIQPHVTSYELVRGARVAGRYVLEARLGEGAMGVVWRATRSEDGEQVAIKLLKGFDRASRRRFLREVSMAAALAHPCLVRVVEVLPDVEADCPALVLELLVGRPLSARLAQGALTMDLARRSCADVASALAYVHEQGAIHRDLKPANVFLVEPAANHPGSVKVLDLGLATVGAPGQALAPTSRITRTGEAVGTPLYMAPELLAGGKATPAADVWSLGVTMYEALTGQRPFAGPTSAALLRDIRSSAGAPFARLQSAAPPSLNTLLRAMLTEDASERPPMAAVAERLASL